MDNICQRIRGGGQHQAVSYGGLDAATGTRILQRLADLRALTPAMLSAFRGCPVAELSLNRNPRVTNALLAELGRKVGNLFQPCDGFGSLLWFLRKYIGIAAIVCTRCWR